jgi:hypothetical protein
VNERILFRNIGDKEFKISKIFTMTRLYRIYLKIAGAISSFKGWHSLSSAAMNIDIKNFFSRNYHVTQKASK